MEPNDIPPVGITSHEPPVESTDSSVKTSNHWLTPINALLLAGSSLIVIAIFVLIYSSWNSFNPASRILMSVIPLVILYALAFANQKNNNQAALAHYTLLTGSVIFPLVIGVVLYQGHIIETIGTTFYFWVFCISLIWYLFLEFIYKNKWHAPFTILSAIGTTYCFLSTINAQDSGYSFAGVILGGVFLFIGYRADTQNEAYESRLFNAFGGLFEWLGLWTFPLTYFAISFGSQTTLAYLVISLIFFTLAIIYSLSWQHHHSEDLLSLRRFSEYSFAGTLTIPAMLALMTDPHQSLNALLAIVLGVASVALSGFIRLQLLRILGYMTAIWGVLIILFYAFTEIKAAWPITLLLIGFALIGLAYGYQHNKPNNFFRRLFALPENSLFHLGEMPETEEKSSINFRHSEQPATGCMVLIGVVVAIYLFYFLVALLAGISI